MTSIASRRLQQYAFVAAAALGLLVGAPRLAQAFTFTTADGVAADSGAALQNPTRQFDGGDGTASADSHGQATMQLGGGVSLQFGARDPRSSFDAEYDSSVNRMFNPLGRPGGPDGR